MQTLLERKRHYIQLITRSHSLYLPDSAIAVDAAKALERLPEQVLFYLSHLAPKKTGAPGDEPVFLLTREDVTNYAREMGMPGEVITDEVLHHVKMCLASATFPWPLALRDAVKDAVRQAINWALKS